LLHQIQAKKWLSLVSNSFPAASPPLEVGHFPNLVSDAALRLGVAQAMRGDIRGRVGRASAHHLNCKFSSCGADDFE
jgi:hypothetical protein